jgi:hypothetical protein
MGNKLNIVSKLFFFPSWLVKETILLMMFVDDDVQLTLGKLWSCEPIGKNKWVDIHIQLHQEHVNIN